jgi:DNA-binding CsgD family transcriptional regulator
MTALVADHLQITRLWVSAVLKNLNGTIVVKETGDREKCFNNPSRPQKDILVTSASFLQPENYAGYNIKSFITAFAARILIFDSKLPEDTVLLFDDVIMPDDSEQKIIEKFDRLIKSFSGDHEKNHGSEDISHREKEVLRLVALGLTNKEIGAKLFISSHTVISHRKNITAKLGIRTIAGLTLYAVINKLITPEDIQER